MQACHVKFPLRMGIFVKLLVKLPPIFLLADGNAQFPLSCNWLLILLFTIIVAIIGGFIVIVNIIAAIIIKYNIIILVVPIEAAQICWHLGKVGDGGE